RWMGPHIRLYTEMVTTAALLHGRRDALLRYDPSEHPLALQLGGSEPADLALCARMAEDLGYDEINLNVGCPSDRVQQGRIGACLMAEPERVADCFSAMQAAVTCAVSIKHRLGINGLDRMEDLYRFMDTQFAAGCRHFIVHARIAILEGLSPKENREIPPLRYEDAHYLKQRYPEAIIVVNGGIRSLDEVQMHLEHVDGVMIGREAYHNPYLLAHIEACLWGVPLPTRTEILSRYLPFMADELAAGTPLTQMTRHILGLYQGVPGARRWRQILSDGAHRSGAGLELIEQARCAVEDRGSGSALS
ncbi:MAG: tRNA dihydrouridine(20/20a) synthase DusA, partial [Pseudomonadales bacterium]|nr:tRNA dihydrouridine(20/20a) synthase DusA [Pseudomonadales bacterium]